MEYIKIYNSTYPQCYKQYLFSVTNNFANINKYKNWLTLGNYTLEYTGIEKVHKEIQNKNTKGMPLLFSLNVSDNNLDIFTAKYANKDEYFNAYGKYLKEIHNIDLQWDFYNGNSFDIINKIRENTKLNNITIVGVLSSKNPGSITYREGSPQLHGLIVKHDMKNPNELYITDSIINTPGNMLYPKIIKANKDQYYKLTTGEFEEMFYSDLNSKLIIDIDGSNYKYRFNEKKLLLDFYYRQVNNIDYYHLIEDLYIEKQQNILFPRLQREIVGFILPQHMFFLEITKIVKNVDIGERRMLCESIIDQYNSWIGLYIAIKKMILSDIYNKRISNLEKRILNIMYQEETINKYFNLIKNKQRI